MIIFLALREQCQAVYNNCKDDRRRTCRLAGFEHDVKWDTLVARGGIYRPRASDGSDWQPCDVLYEEVIEDPAPDTLQP